jgi:hypothetical protein
MAHEFTSVFSFLLPEFYPPGLIGDSGFVSPEAALLDTPKIIGMLNGAISLVNFGLTSCNGGYGPALSWGFNEGLYNTSSGIISFIITTENQFDTCFETFEGPSLVGGFDSRCVGRDNGAFTSTAKTDYRATTNHALKVAASWTGEVFTRLISLNETIGPYVIKFRYFSPITNGGGCIGLYDWNNLGNITSAGNWLTCQYQIPTNLGSFRIGLHKAGGATVVTYFDDVQVTFGNGTTCTGVSLPPWTPPGREGYSASVINTLATLMTAGVYQPLTRRRFALHLLTQAVPTTACESLSS